MNHLAIYDKVWEAIFGLPRHAQKSFSDFVRKFRENSKSSGIHLEPISTFADPQLRTARVSNKYRAIIRVPKTGTTYHLLHVDNHDEAMAWARRKVFNWNENTESYQVYTIPEATEVESPALQPPTAPAAAPNSIFAQTDDELLAIGVPEVLLPSVRQVNDQDSLEQLYDYLPIEALENLSMLLEGAEYHTILREVDAGKSNAENRTEQEQSANNQRSFFDLTDDDLLNEMLNGKVAKWRIFLHPSQRKIVEGQFKGPTKVTGGAGTGKTVAALHRARMLEQQGKATREQPILFTTYTKALSQNLEKELQALGCNPVIVQLRSVDAFVVESARAAGLIDGGKILDFPGSKTALNLWREVTDFRTSPFSPNFLDDEYREVLLHQNIKDKATYFTASRRGRQRRVTRKDRMEIWELFLAYEEEKQRQGYHDLYEIYNLLTGHFDALQEKPFRHVIADELQDFSNVHLRLLRSAVAEGANDLFLVGDPLQKIYRRRIVFSEAGINIRGRRSQRLKINYRTTERIRKAAINVVRGIEFSDFEDGVEPVKGYVSLRIGQEPSYDVFRTKEEEVASVVRQLSDYLSAKETGGRAVPAQEICIATRRRSDAKVFRKALHRAGIPYYDLTEGRVPTGDVEGGVRLSTFHNLKGLEFKVVFLGNLSKSTFPFHPADFQNWTEGEREMHHERERSLLYVAITRAIVEAHLSGVGERFE
jgi:superfamily I DNA/RNA helicase